LDSLPIGIRWEPILIKERQVFIMNNQNQTPENQNKNQQKNQSKNQNKNRAPQTQGENKSKQEPQD
jgi:hypothetical protein